MTSTSLTPWSSETSSPTYPPKTWALSKLSSRRLRRWINLRWSTTLVNEIQKGPTVKKKSSLLSSRMASSSLRVQSSWSTLRNSWGKCCCFRRQTQDKLTCRTSNFWKTVIPQPSTLRKSCPRGPTWRRTSSAKLTSTKWCLFKTREQPGLPRNLSSNFWEKKKT